MKQKCVYLAYEVIFVKNLSLRNLGHTRNISYKEMQQVISALRVTLTQQSRTDLRTDSMPVAISKVNIMLPKRLVMQA